MMKYVCEENMCNGCAACVNICPKHCISISKSFFCYNAVINSSACINCKKCESVCPNHTLIDLVEPVIWRQGWNLDSDRNISSSGGIAFAIIKSFITSGGYVASCLFSEGRFIFDLTKDLDEARLFAGSKYVKSNPEDIYIKIKKVIKESRVLFIGLPCQVAAIKSYFYNNSNLYTVDLICHGTPSDLVLEKYLADKKINVSDIRDIKFRNKAKFGLIVDGTRLAVKNTSDDYTVAFLNGIDYTDNCYRCRYATEKRVSDLTLGDCWGTDNTNEEANGVSLILIQSVKGKELIENANVITDDVDIQSAKINNKQLTHPSVVPKNRRRFLKLLQKNVSFSKAMFMVNPSSYTKRMIKGKIMKLFDH